MTKETLCSYIYVHDITIIILVVCIVCLKSCTDIYVPYTLVLLGEQSTIPTHSPLVHSYRVAHKICLQKGTNYHVYPVNYDLSDLYVNLWWWYKTIHSATESSRRRTHHYIVNNHEAASNTCHRPCCWCHVVDCPTCGGNFLWWQ